MSDEYAAAVQDAFGGGNAPQAEPVPAQPPPFLQEQSAPAEPFAPPQPEAVPLHGPPANEYALAVADSQRQDAGRLGYIYEESLKKNPERQAGIVDLARKTGIPADAVERRYDEIARSFKASQHDSAQWQKDNPELADFLLSNPEAAAIVHQDAPVNLLTQTLKKGWGLLTTPPKSALLGEPGYQGEESKPLVAANPLSEEHGLFRVPMIEWDAFKRGMAAFRRGNLGAEIASARLAGRDTFELEKQLADIDTQIRPQAYGQGPWEQLAIDAFQGLGSMAQFYGTTLAASGVSGAIAGGITLAATKNPAQALEAGKVAADISGSLAAFGQSFWNQAGDGFLQYREVMPEKVAIGMAAAEGVVNAGIEVLQLRQVAGANKPIAQLLESRDGRQFLEYLKKDKTFTSLATSIAKSYFGATAAESAEEGAQSLVTDLFGYLGKSYAAGKWLDPDIKGSVATALEQVGQALPAAAIASAPGHVVQAGHLAVMAARGELATKQRESIDAAAKGSATAKQAPSVVAELIRRQTAESGQEARAMYIDPAPMVTLFQSQNIDPGTGAEEILGPGGQAKLEEAVRTGGKIEVPMEDYLQRIAGKPIGDALAEHVTTSPILPTAAEAKEQAKAQAEVPAQAQKLAEQYLAENDNPEAPAAKPKSEAETRLVDEVAKQLAQTGVTDKADARRSIATVRAFLRTQAERFGLNPDELFGHVALSVQRRGAAATQAEGGTSFDFGANVQDLPGQSALSQEQTQQLQEALPQPPETTSKGYTLNPDERAAAEAAISRMREPRRSKAMAFLAYSQGETDKPVEIPRSLETHLAKLGVVDPAGFATEDDLRHRKRGGKRKTGPRGEQPAELKRHRLEKNMTPEERRSATYRSFRQGALQNVPDEVLPFLSEGTVKRLFQSEAPKSETLSQGSAEDSRGHVDLIRDGAKRLIEARVILGPEADASTFLHEAGHVFLELFGELAERPDAPAQVKEDWAKTLEYLGASDRASIATEHHEKWARSLEAYYHEGKAPAPGLTRVFRRLSLWLRQVYRSIRALGVDLSPDITGVFDRLFATDSEIARARRNAALKPMFATQQEAGMNAQQWAAYQEASRRAVERATAAVDAKVLRDKLIETESWWKAEEKKLRAEGLTAFDGRKDAIAAEYLHKGKLPEEWGGQTKKGGKLDRQSVVDLVGEEWAKEFRTTSNQHEGEGPDDVAGLFGFATGKEMLDAVLGLPDRKQWAKDWARDRMRERHPDILQEREELTALAQKSLHGPDSADAIVAELKAIRAKWQSEARAKFDQELTGALKEQKRALEDSRRRPESAKAPLPVEAIKEAARLIVEKSTVRKLNPFAALQRANSLAAKSSAAVEKGQWEIADVYKGQQLLNFHIYRELTKAVEARDKFQELAKALKDPKSRARLGKVDSAYRDGVDTVLEAVGLRELVETDQPPATLDKVISVLEKNDENVSFDPELIGRILHKPQFWKDLTVAELRGVSDFLRNVRAAARNGATAMVLDQRLGKEVVMNALADEAAHNLPNRGAESSSREAESIVESGLKLATGARGEALKPETMLRQLGGDSVDSMWHKAVIYPLQQAKAKEADILASVMKPVVDALDDLTAKHHRALNQLVDGKALFPTHVSKIEPPRRMFELIPFFWNSGTESNLSKLTSGRNITPEQVARAIDLLPKEVLDAAQAVLDSVNKLGPMAFDLEERYSGVRPEKQPAQPIVTRHGTYAGGYFPVVYDDRVSNAGAAGAASEVAVNDPTFVRPGTNKNYLKARNPDFAEVISVSLGTVRAHFVKVAHDIAFREPLRSVSGLIMSPRIQEALRQGLGDAKKKLFLTWLKDIGSSAARQIDQERNTGRIYGFLRGGYTFGAMAYNFAVATGDLANLAQNFLVKGAKASFVAKGTLEFFSNVPAARELALAKSGEMRFRASNVQRRFDSAMKSLQGSPIARATGLAFLRDHAFSIFEMTDAATSTPLWLGTYRQALSEGMDDGKAVRFADDKVRKAYPSHSAVDLPAILRSPGFWGKLLVFHSYWNTVYNMSHERIHEAYLAHGWKKIPALAVMAGHLIALGAATNLLAEALSFRGPSKDDGDDELERLGNWTVRNLLLGAMRQTPIGSIAAPVVEGYVLHKDPSVRAAPGLAPIVDLTKAAQKLTSGRGSDEAKQHAVFQATKAFGMFLGVPAQLSKTTEYVTKAAQGTAPADNPLDIAHGLIAGPPYQGKKGRR